MGRLHKHQRETEIAATHQPPKFTMETGKRDPEEAAAVLGSPSGEETAATSAKERQQHERQRMEHMQGAKETVSREEIERLVKQKHALAGNAPDADLEIAAARGRGGGAEMPTNEEKVSASRENHRSLASALLLTLSSLLVASLVSSGGVGQEQGHRGRG